MDQGIDESFLHTLPFADDLIIMERMMSKKLSEVQIYQVIGANGQFTQKDDIVIEYCQEYKYLGTIISKEGDCRKEKDNKVWQATKAVQDLNFIW